MTRRDLVLRTAQEELAEAITGLQLVCRLLAETAELDAIARAPRSQRARMLLRESGENAPAPSLRMIGMTVSEAAKRLDMSEENVRRLLRRGVIDGVPYGGRTGWRMEHDYVEQIATRKRRGSVRPR